MKLNLKDKKVLVTGSSSGIGLEIVKAFIDQGSQVIANSRTQSSLNNAIKSLRCHGIAADVTSPDDCKMLVTKAIDILGGIDILVCNVGSGISVKPGDENFDEWQKSFLKNFFSATNIIESSQSQLSKSNGVILCISSICGSRTIKGAPVTYSVSKAALNSYIKGIAGPFSDQGIRINAISPGNIIFENSEWDKKYKENPSKVNAMISQDVPLNRFGTPEDVANLALWLTSSLSSFVTGSIYITDGGQLSS
jgi:3-oxoacyl-[acyl-carrier protein] reductase